MLRCQYPSVCPSVRLSVSAERSEILWWECLFGCFSQEPSLRYERYPRFSHFNRTAFPCIDRPTFESVNRRNNEAWSPRFIYLTKFCDFHDDATVPVTLSYSWFKRLNLDFRKIEMEYGGHLENRNTMISATVWPISTKFRTQFLTILPNKTAKSY